MKKWVCVATMIFFLSSCSFNPFIWNNRTTGSAETATVGAVAGAGVGAGTVAALGGSKPWLWGAGITGGFIGGMIGYYVSTLRFDSAGVLAVGGVVYKVGEFVGIYIPTDYLFDFNTDDFTPQAGAILDSARDVLARYPNNNILISGNTSGFARARWENRLSEARARKVSAYLWDAGINNFAGLTNNLRKLNYVGYGNYFPISGDLVNKAIRQNSRIQIVSYPSNADLYIDKTHVAVHNIGSLDEGLAPSPADQASIDPCPSHTFTESGACVSK